MPNVDSLDIQISASAKGASRALDDLTSKLGALSTALGNLDASGLHKFSSGMSMLSKGMQGFQNVKKADFNRTVKGIKEFEKVNSSKLQALSTVLTPLGNSISALNNVQFNNGNITSFVNAMTRLSNSSIGSFNVGALSQVGNAIHSLATQLSAVPEVSRNTIQMTNAISRLGASGGTIGMVSSALPQLGATLSGFFSTMSRASMISDSTIQFTTAIAQLANAGKKTQTTASNLNTLAVSLKNFFAVMSNADVISQNTIQFTQAIAQLANAGAGTGSAGRGLAGAFNGISSGVSSFTKFGGILSSVGGTIRRIMLPSIGGLNGESKSLASTIGLLYAKFWVLKRVIGLFGKSVGSAQDYIEEFNYFSVAMNKVGQDSKDQWKKNGYSSAEEYADSFRSRFGKLQKQMTGYTVDYDTGDATSDMSHNLGLNLTEVMKYNAAITQITNSAGMLGETSITTSKALSMLSADWSSLANQDLSQTQNALQSGLIGNSRALYQFGIDTTKAGLAQVAMAHGVKVNVTALSQETKMQLRTLAMLEQSKVAYGDLGRTINQPANQLRMLEMGFQNLSRTIGSLFMPMVEKLYPYLNAMVSVLQDFFQWIAKINGIKLGGDDSSMKLPEYEDAADEADDYSKATNKAAKATKKLKDNIQGFDILNKLQDNDDTGVGSTPKGNNATPQDFDFSSDIEKALKNYEKIWKEAFESNKNKAIQYAQKLKKALLQGWRNGGDYTFLGSAVANWINQGLSKIPWDKIKKTCKKLAKSLATFLNGFIKDLDWVLVGKTFAEGLNTVVDTAYTFLTTFDWLEFGKALATGINSFIHNVDAKKLGKTLGARLRAMIQTAYGFVTNFNYKELGTKISDGINGYFEQMGKVDKRTGKNGWQELGTTLTEGISGIADTIITALNGVKWENVGEAIGDFLGSLSWTKIFGKIVNVIATALASALRTAISAFAKSPTGVISALGVAFGAIFALKKLTPVLAMLKIPFTGLFQGASISGIAGIKIKAIKDALSTKFSGSAFASVGTTLGKTIGTVAQVALVGAIVGGLTEQIGKALKNGRTTDDNTISYAIGDSIEKSGKFVGDLASFNFPELAKDLSELGDAWKGTTAGGDVNHNSKEYKNYKIGEGKKVAKEIASIQKKEGNSGVREYLENLKSDDKSKYESYLYYLKDKNDLSTKSAKTTRTNITSTKEYSKQVRELQKNMDKLKIPTQQQNSYLAIMKNALENGTISMKTYKNVVKESAKGSQELADKIGKIRTKDIKVTVKTSGKKDVDDMKNSIDSIPVSKTSTFTVNANTTDFISKMNDLTTGKSITVKMNVDSKDFVQKVRKALSGSNFQLKAGQIFPNAQQIKAYFKTVMKSPAFKEMTNGLSNFGVNGRKLVVDKKKKTVKIPKEMDITKALGNSYSMAGYKVTYYKGGGFPNKGDLFVANEAGPEMVGSMNGKTTVANNNQISEGFAKAITASLGPAIYAATKQAVSESISSADIGGGDVYLDGKKITTEIMSNAKKISRQRGVAWNLT